MAEQQPMIALVSASILVGAKRNLQNFQPALLDPYTTWNLDHLYWSRPAGASR